MMMSMNRLLLFAILTGAILTGPVFAADKLSFHQLADMAGKPDAAPFAEALGSTLGDKAVSEGTAVLGEGPDFLWAVKSAKAPDLYVDDVKVGTLQQAGQSGVWFYSGKLRTGTSHNFYYMVDGAKLGGKNDIPAYGPDSYQKPGVPEGKLSEKMVHTSKIYPGMQSDWWIYVPAQYDAGKPAALMVWHDGQGMANRNGLANSLNVFDNLIAQGKIPVMIQVFIAPGNVGEKKMRSIEYDTVSDKYARFLRDEILPEVYAKYNVRKDSYSRGIAGNSSGGISSFSVAWFQPDQFSRVLMRIASFANLQQNHPGEFDGGNTFPYRVRREDKRNIRVWSQDGSEDLENPFGSWPANNINMVNSLKFREYDFHFSWGTGSHSGSHGNAELPEAMTWLWREYDPAKTEQAYTMDPAEKNKPFYRVKTFNRQ
jgi:enterochelin esterase-like enzyme